jgi:DNA-binding XRE family transcriptional regulator
LDKNEDNLVKKVCKEYNITQAELSKMLDIPKGTIGRWNSTNKIPKTAELALKLMIENKQLKDELKGIQNFKRVLKELIIETKTFIFEEKS